MANGALTFSHTLPNDAGRSPGRSAISFPHGRNLTFADLYGLVEAAAVWLLYSGVRNGDVVFLVFPNIVEFVVCLLAVMRCRAVAVPLDLSCTRGYFESCLRTYGPKLLLVGPDGDPAKQAAAAAHGVPHAAASVHYDPSDSVHTYALVLLTSAAGGLTPLVPVDISRVVNEPEDVALFLPPVAAGLPASVTQEELVTFIVNIDSALRQILPLFLVHGLPGDLPCLLSATLHEKAIEYALKLNELALMMSTSSMIAMSIFLMNHQGLIQTNMWVSTVVLLFFASFALSLAGVQYHLILGRSCMYVGKAALFAFFSGVAMTAITVLPEKHGLMASVVASVYVGLLTILIIIEGGAWQLIARGRIRVGTAEMAAAAEATPASGTFAVAAAASASPIQAPDRIGQLDSDYPVAVA